MIHDIEGQWYVSEVKSKNIVQVIIFIRVTVDINCVSKQLSHLCCIKTAKCVRADSLYFTLSLVVRAVMWTPRCWETAKCRLGRTDCCSVIRISDQLLAAPGGVSAALSKSHRTLQNDAPGNSKQYMCLYMFVWWLRTGNKERMSVIMVKRMRQLLISE